MQYRIAKNPVSDVYVAVCVYA